MIKKWIVADLHFDHKNIIKYCNRPFSSVEEMNKTLITNINNTVGIDDEFYILGDVTFNHKKVRYWLEEIKCQNKILILGNHDSHKPSTYEGISGLKSINHYLELKNYHNSHIVMCHYPLARWHQQNRGSYHMYGHVHANFSMPGTNSLDVGVDSIGMKPIEIKDAIRTIDDNNRGLDLRE